MGLVAETIGVTSPPGKVQLSDLLSPEQAAAMADILAWLADPLASSFFVLEGYAGTGKTFTCQAIVNEIKGRVIFTAPTNKAVKVLKKTLTRDTYKPEAATIYSLLGLRMEANGEVKELTKRERIEEETLDISNYKLVVVDEGSMAGPSVLPHIHEAAQETGVRFLFMGDPAQLPPVGYDKSEIWEPEFTTNRARLTKVMRHDNAILNLVTAIREVVWRPAPTIQLGRYAKADEVLLLAPDKLQSAMRVAADLGAFSSGRSKAIAWRNVTVDTYNRLIRKQIYGEEASSSDWLVEDRIVFTSPGNDLDEKPQHRTDDEGLVQSAHVSNHPLYPEFKVWRLGVALDDGRLVTGFVLHRGSLAGFNQEKARLSAAAKANPRAWKEFWALVEAFHQARHAYALTAHRAQGSTYEAVYVDYRDILVNRNRVEAYKCLYVACSRASKKLYLG